MKIEVVKPIKCNFGMVPRALWDAPLSRNAKILAAYYFCQPPGSAPYVGEIEAKTGIGRDARRRAFQELKAFGVVRARANRHRMTGKFIGKTLEVFPSVFERKPYATEFQGDGYQAPENPTFGNSADEALKPDQSPTESPALNKDKEKEEGQSPSDAALKQANGGCQLSNFQMSQLRKGESLLFEGRLVKPGSAEFADICASVGFRRVH